MSPVFKRYIGTALVLMLALTGQAMAIARGAPGPAGQVELCTGGGPVMVYLDETGAPVGPPHICPDFALSLILQVAEPEMRPQPVDAPYRLATVRADLQNTELPQPPMLARAPPPGL
ncbi:hypothetical protein [Sedimentitalea todarodis]|uniref:DUF2946 domain-containing protein n=1 Tax=Sedimentitalea todarodis TaxID=1631240 RepID=A0ABU3VCY8_9RHOB|nr:hypothetical protein [Sedimentitalea todarodis]MDU9004014.1 hypothetical protein [Sedimentitalea todarodis]